MKLENDVPFVRSETLSKEEDKLETFCKNNGIKYEKTHDTSGRGKNNYSFTFEPNYIDITEAKVVEYIKKHRIDYTFTIDEDHNHHYTFEKLIDLNSYGYPEYNCPKNAKTIIKSEFNKFKNHSQRSEEMPVSRNRESISFEDVDKKIEEIKHKLSEAEKEIEQLRTKGNLKNLWQKFWYYVWSPYRNEIKNIVKQEIENLQNKVAYFQKEINNAEQEKKDLFNALVLAGIL